MNRVVSHQGVVGLVIWVWCPGFSLAPCPSLWLAGVRESVIRVWWGESAGCGGVSHQVSHQGVVGLVSRVWWGLHCTSG